MFIRGLANCPEFTAGDKTVFRELLHPAKANLRLGYSLGQAVVKSGQESRPHRLKSSEVYYILTGVGEMKIDDESAEVQAGQAIYIPPLAKQSIKNTGHSDLEFLCMVDPAWRVEDEEVLE